MALKSEIRSDAVDERQDIQLGDDMEKADSGWPARNAWP